MPEIRIQSLREQFSPELYAAAYPLIDSVEVSEQDRARVRATVSGEHEVVAERSGSTCSCPTAEGERWMCRHKLAVFLRYWSDAGSVSLEDLDDEHLRVMVRTQLERPHRAVPAYLATRTRDELTTVAISGSFESSGVGWPLRADAARWSMDALSYADHLYAGIDHELDVEAACEPMVQIPPRLRTVSGVLWNGTDYDNPVQLLPAATLLLTRMRQVIEVSMPVSSEVRRFYGACMQLVQEIYSLGAATWAECADLIGELEVDDREPEALCPSLQWFTPMPELAAALRSRLVARAESTFEELMAFSDIRVTVEPDLARRWNRLLSVTAELAFSQGDVDELGLVLARWGDSPYGEFMRRASNTRSRGQLLPITEQAARAGRVTHLSWTEQLRTPVTNVENERMFSGMASGVAVSSLRTSLLHDVSFSVLVGGLLEVGRREAALDALREQFHRCPAPEAVPALQTWWERTGAAEDVVEWARSIMLGSNHTL